MKLETFLQESGIGYERHSHPTTYTSQALAHAEHVSGHMVAKPVIVKSGTGFVMCVIPAPAHLDLKRVAAALNEGEVALAREAEMADLFPECELGAEPPIGPMFNMTTIMDSRLKSDEFLVMQAGKHTEAIKIRRPDWERVCRPQVAPITAD